VNLPYPTPTTSGPAFRVTILGPQQAEAYEHVFAMIDEARRVVHLFNHDGKTHFLSIPASSALIEWKDPTELRPRLRVPPFGPGAFDGFGQQIQNMMKGFHGLGEEGSG
jgi:hypothetical protein